MAKKDSRIARAYRDFPGQHVFFDNNRVVAHGRDGHEVFIQYLEQVKKRWPNARPRFLLHVEPEGTPERHYVVRPRARIRRVSTRPAT